MLVLAFSQQGGFLNNIDFHSPLSYLLLCIPIGLTFFRGKLKPKELVREVTRVELETTSWQFLLEFKPNLEVRFRKKESAK